MRWLWSDEEMERHVEDLQEVRNQFRAQMVEAKRAGNTYAYMQARRKVLEMQEEIERHLDVGSRWRLMMHRKRERKRARWRRTGMKAGQPYREEEDA